MSTRQLPIELASLLADPRTIIARDTALELADADPAVLQSLADPETDLDAGEALAVVDDDDARRLCPHGCGEAVYPRADARHIAQECEAVDRDPFGGDAQEARAR